MRALTRARRALRRYDEARRERDTAIRDAVREEGSQRRVARELGLSHTRIQQILRDH